MQRSYCVIWRGYCDGYPATKKDRQWKLPKKIAFKFASRRRRNVISGYSSFFLNNAHLNSGSNGIGGLPELHFLFGRGNLVKSESLELELESAKTFARHILLGE